MIAIKTKAAKSDVMGHFRWLLEVDEVGNEAEEPPQARIRRSQR